MLLDYWLLYLRVGQDSVFKELSDINRSTNFLFCCITYMVAYLLFSSAVPRISG
jgi:hypothetical protein